jgi:hypothetical protein
MNIFLSHWSNESTIALLLKEWLENVFDDINVFVSSSENDIDYGQEWERAMFEALDQANLLIVLVSTKSYNRKWIHIETGYSLAKKIKPLIIRIDDILPEVMGRPYDNYQTLSVQSQNFTKSFFSAISTLSSQPLRENIGFDYMQMDIVQKCKLLK